MGPYLQICYDCDLVLHSVMRCGSIWVYISVVVGGWFRNAVTYAAYSVISSRDAGESEQYLYILLDSCSLLRNSVGYAIGGVGCRWGVSFGVQHPATLRSGSTSASIAAQRRSTSPHKCLRNAIHDFSIHIEYRDILYNSDLVLIDSPELLCDW